MYYIMIWDTNLAALERDGCLDKVDIPLDLAFKFFQLDNKEYAILSKLSFDDYDIFSDRQIELLKYELIRFVKLNTNFSEKIDQIIALIDKAKILEKKILFDPFRYN